jgi:hypothetical protein
MRVVYKFIGSFSVKLNITYVVCKAKDYVLVFVTIMPSPANFLSPVAVTV